MKDDAPQAIHGKAIDKACQDDREWFAARPGRRFRLRDPVPMEFNGPDPVHGLGRTPKVLVCQFGEGLRARMPVGIIAGAFVADRDDELRPIFLDCAPDQMIDGLRRAEAGRSP